MNLKNIKNDRSGVATLLIILIVVVIVVVAAGAAYVVMSGDGGNKNGGNGGTAAEEQLAPGTYMEFDMKIDTTPIGTVSLRYLGQNADEIFVKTTMSINLGAAGTMNVTKYGLSPKGDASSPLTDPDVELKKVGTINDFDTFAGKKKVDKWEYTENINGTNYKGYIYIDAKQNMFYKMEMPMEWEGGVKTAIIDMKALTLVSQKSDAYTPSANIGKTTKFALSTDPTKLVEVKVVADCQGGKFGVAYDFTNVAGDFLEYYLCDTTDGKITDAIAGAGGTWKYKESMTFEGITIDIVDLTLYINSSGLYKIVLKEFIGPTYTFNLVAS